MELVLQQKQSLNLVMTTELRQAIQLLQYSSYELYQFLQDQQLENPLIELEEKTPDNFYQDRSQRINKQYDSNFFDLISAQENDMHDYLMEQTQWLDITKRDQETIDYLILNLDENGYLSGDIKELAAEISLDHKTIQSAMNHLQRLEPIGVGAQNLRECLLLQAKYYYPDEQLLHCVIREHLDQLVNKKWSLIAKQLQVPLSELKYIYNTIQQFDPKPCAKISRFQADYVTPDVVVEQKEDGYSVYLNDSFLPHIQLNPQYAAFLSSKNEVSSYIKDKYDSYQWLINSLEQRRSTILRISDVLIRKQHAFLLEGFQALQPLTLSEVADEIDMHESTVSRATMNKSIQTPHGTFEIRHLFASKLISDKGDTSQATVKGMLKNLVEKESKLKPYSDQKIAEYFKTKRGVTISRRTVAKYREELKIPSSNKRKEIDI